VDAIPAALLRRAASEAVKVLSACGSVLLPLSDFRLVTDHVEALGEAIAKLPPEKQVPIFVVGGASRFLRRCHAFAEWCDRDRASLAHAGKSPFLVEALVQTERLILAETQSELQGVYREPCVVLAPSCSIAGCCCSLPIALECCQSCLTHLGV